MLLRDNNPALLLIDFQKGFEDEKYWGGNRNNKNAEQNAKEILDLWRSLKLPVFHIIHSSQNPNSLLHVTQPGFDIITELQPIAGEPLLKKKVNSAFIGTGLKELLDVKKITSLVIIGLTTNHCISTSTRMAGNLGFNTYLVSDATATFDRIGINGEKYSAQLVHDISLASLNDEFARVLNTKSLLKMM